MKLHHLLLVFFATLLCLAATRVSHAEEAARAPEQADTPTASTQQEPSPLHEDVHPSTRKFDEGRRLMRSGNYEAACQAFEESQRLQEHVGTLLNLALCLKKRKMYASAREHYLRAAELAKARGDERADFGAREAQRLDDLVAQLRIEVLGDDETTRIEINGDPVEAAVAMAGVPVDPGTYTVVISQEDREPAEVIVEVVPGERPGVRVVGPLAKTSVRSEEPNDMPSLPTEVGASESAPVSSDFPWRTLGWGAVFGGGASVAVGGILYGVGISQVNRADCQRETGICSPEGFEVRSQGARLANGGIVAVVSGGLVALGGVGLVLWAPRNSPSLSVGPTPGRGLSLRASGRF